MRKDILLTLGPISEKIQIQDTRINIENLQIFEFTNKSEITFGAADIHIDRDISIFNVPDDTTQHENIAVCTSKKLLIKINDGIKNLDQLIRILRILLENRLKILDQLVNNVDTVSFALNPTDAFGRVADADSRMLSYPPDAQYPVDKKEIILENCDLSEKQLGVTYKNIVQWLKMIQNTYGNDKLHDKYYVHLTFNKSESP